MDQNVKFAVGKEQTVRAGRMYLGTRNWKPKHSLGQGSLVSPRQVERETGTLISLSGGNPKGLC